MQTLHLASDQHRGQIGRMAREFESKGIWGLQNSLKKMGLRQNFLIVLFC